MTQLHFRIIIIPQPDEEPDMSHLKLCVEKCDLLVHSMQRVELEKTKGPTHPEILEYIVDVRAENQNVISNKNKVFVYKELSLKWCQVTNDMMGGRPILQFYLNECFLRKRVSSQLMQLASISFGVHPRFGEYISYSTRVGIDSIGGFYHDVKELEIITVVDLNDDPIFYKRTENNLVISYRHIRNIIVTLDGHRFDMYLDLLHPPLFYIKTVFKYIIDRKPTVTNKRVLPFQMNKDIAGKSNFIRLCFQHSHESLELLSCLRSRCDWIPIQFVAMTIKVKTPPTMPLVDFAHFGCAYMWKAIIERTFSIVEQAVDVGASVEKILRYSQQNGDCLEQVLTTILFIIDSGRFVNYWHTIDVLYSAYVSHRNSVGFNDFVVPSKCRLIRRVTITPTRIMLWPPDLMCENRILRNFESDFFLRVTFRDDDFLPMNFRRYLPLVFDEVITKPMNSGLIIGHRHYQMLAWSSSQLREHGVSMYARDSRGNSSADIRRWTEIDPRTSMNIPKCLARIGQCFSQTEDTLHVPLDEAHIRFEEDIEHGLNPVAFEPYSFSDGVGKISTDLAGKVTKTFRHGQNCSAFQIRFGGCKGMLVVDPTLRNTDIVFRESMRKFECRGHGHTKLEIAKKSGPICMRLNRPLIAILNDLGVKQRIFLKLQENMLQNLTDMLLDEELACEYLNSRTPFSEFKFKDLSQSGVGLTAEPFFRTLLLALHRYYIDLIKTKANIDLDPALARNMFGVMDETGKLEYGQVFVQYSSDVSLGVSTPDDTKILKGTVMVTKFPCVHPADVRKFAAVDVPELHHIVDCIVFPQKGPRPHPDEMAGSDLDGDEYAVIWMKDLVFSRENTAPPHYPKPNSNVFKNVSDFLSLSRTEKIVDFLVNYIQNDQIGHIASCHLAWADRKSIFDETALDIAAKHAISVDFAKTGCSAHLSYSERPKEFPDFMEKFFQKKYKSKKSLGKMYRVSKDFEMENQAAVLQYHGVEVDPTLVVTGWEKFEESALKSRNEYNNRLKTVLQTYGISHETEAFGGAFIKLHHRFRERRDRAEIVLLVHTWLKELVAKTRELFFENMPATCNAPEIVKDFELKASAWYIVTYREKDPDFLSFPWVISEFLANIRILNVENIQRKPMSRMPLVFKLEELVKRNADADMLPRLSSEAMFFLNACHCLCDRPIVERALSILTKWGNEERIISTTHTKGKFLFYKTFVRLILYVAELEGYVSKGGGQQNGNLTSAGLCISFFKFCMKLRFLNKPEVKNVLPFYVYNDRLLSKRAIVTFHSIAVTGIFPTLCFEEYLSKPPELIDMKPVPIESSIFGISPIAESVLRNAEFILLELSEMEQITMRENCQRKKIIVDACGTMFSMQRLKSILRKKKTYLEELFKTGEEQFPHFEEADF